MNVGDASRKIGTYRWITNNLYYPRNFLPIYWHCNNQGTSKETICCVTFLPIQRRVSSWSLTHALSLNLYRSWVWNRALHWCHNDHDGVSNHQPHGCLLNRLFGHRSKKTSKLLVTGLCARNSPGPVNSPHKGPVTRKMFPFDDVIMVGFFHACGRLPTIHDLTFWSC